MDMPETDALEDLIDIPSLRKLLGRFHAATHVGSSILNVKGDILVAVGWKDICVRFHRHHPQTAQRCLESDTFLANQLSGGCPYNVYKCRNGLIDVAVPLVIDGVHMGNLFTGQFLFEEPDIAFFEAQAEEFGFDKEEYLAALREVPIIAEETVRSTLEFLAHLTELIALQGAERKKLREANLLLEQRVKERTSALLQEANSRLEAEKEVRETNLFLESLIQSLPGVLYVFDEEGRYLRWNKNLERVSGYTAEEFSRLTPLEFVAEEDRDAIAHEIQKAFTQGYTYTEAGLRTKSGECIPYLLTGYRFCLKGKSYLIGIGIDISQRVLAEQERESLIARLQDALAEVKQLSGFLPICSNCKKVRDDQGYWNQIEAYLRDHSEVQFSHSLCPTCFHKLYPNLPYPGSSSE